MRLANPDLKTVGSPLAASLTDQCWQQLALAILVRAIKDAQSSCVSRAVAARRWLLFDPWCGDLLAWCDLDRSLMRRWVLALPDSFDRTT